MVYLLHFNKKLHHAQHYIGYSKDENFETRMAHHSKGTGSRLVRAMIAHGAIYCIARLWPGKDGNFERKLKNWKKARMLCPICNANLGSK